MSDRIQVGKYANFIFIGHCKISTYTKPGLTYWIFAAPGATMSSPYAAFLDRHFFRVNYRITFFSIITTQNIRELYDQHFSHEATSPNCRSVVAGQEFDGMFLYVA